MVHRFSTLLHTTSQVLTEYSDGNALLPVWFRYVSIGGDTFINSSVIFRLGYKLIL